MIQRIVTAFVIFFDLGYMCVYGGYYHTYNNHFDKKKGEKERGAYQFFNILILVRDDKRVVSWAQWFDAHIVIPRVELPFVAGRLQNILDTRSTINADEHGLKVVTLKQDEVWDRRVQNKKEGKGRPGQKQP